MSSDSIKVPVRYIPFHLTKKDAKKQSAFLRKSQKYYKQGKYYQRPKVASFHSRKSKHVQLAEKLYNVDTMKPNQTLAKATGCSLSALNQIVRKGEGAYYSSGSRPNQTAASWGYARLASSITGGKSAAVDYKILEAGCDHSKLAYRLAKKSRRKFGYGHSRTKRRVVI